MHFWVQFHVIFSKFVIEAALKYKPHLNTSRSQAFLKRIEASASNTVLTVYQHFHLQNLRVLM